MNDATTNRNEIERVDWNHMAHLLRQIENNTVLADVFPSVSGRTLQYVATDNKRQVRQCFTVSLVESALHGEEGLGEP